MNVKYKCDRITDNIYFISGYFNNVCIIRREQGKCVSCFCYPYGLCLGVNCQDSKIANKSHFKKLKHVVCFKGEYEI
jgi:hypothetical protein